MMREKSFTTEGTEGHRGLLSGGDFDPPDITSLRCGIELRLGSEECRGPSGPKTGPQDDNRLHNRGKGERLAKY